MIGKKTTGFGKALKHFKENRGGNFSLMFGVAAPVLVLSVGAAVDLLGVQSSQTKLQNTLDSAVLSYATNFLLNENSGQASDAANAAFGNNNAGNRESGGNSGANWDIQNPKKEGDEYVIRGTARAYHDNYFMGMIGEARSEINVQSQAKIKISEITTVVVSDISWSMRGDNMRGMQRAMASFGDEMFQMPPEFRSRLQMSSVPFAGSVNISGALRNANNLLRPWEFSSERNDPRNKSKFYQNSGRCDGQFDQHRENIRGNRIELNRHAWEWTHVGDRNEIFINGAGKEQVRRVPIHDWRCVNKGVVERYQWSGCIQMEDNQIRPDFRLGNGSHNPFPTTVSGGGAPHCPNSNTQIQPNIRSASQYRRHAERLEVGFGTSHDIGLLWGSWLMDPDRASDFGLARREWGKDHLPKYMIFLSDGKAHPVGYDFNPLNGRTEDGINSNTQAICNYLKSKKVHIYGISYVRKSAPDAVQNVEQCATKGYHYKGDKDDIEGLFKQIANDIKIKNIRISQ